MKLRLSISVYSADTDDVGASKFRGNGNGLALKQDEEKQITERCVCQYGHTDRQTDRHTHTYTHAYTQTCTHKFTHIHTHTHTN